MNFTHPWALGLLLLFPVLAYRWKHRARSTFSFPAFPLVKHLTSRAWRAEWGGTILRCLGFTLLVFALSGPRWPDPGSRIEVEGISIAMVVDVSASMAEPDFIWQDHLLRRIDGVKKVFRLFVEGGYLPDGTKIKPRSNDLISLVVFAAQPETVCPLTLDHAALVQILEKEEPRTNITEATTNPGDAIAWALHHLQKAPTKRKIMIFLTDGESNVPPPALKPRQAAQLAGNLKIPIYALDAQPDLKEEDSQKAKKIMEDLALITEGKYFYANNARSLGEAMESIDRIEKGRITTFHYSRYYEGFWWFALASLLCWMTAVILENTLWRSWP